MNGKKKTYGKEAHVWLMTRDSLGILYIHTVYIWNTIITFLIAFHFVSFMGLYCYKFQASKKVICNILFIQVLNLVLKGFNPQIGSEQYKEPWLCTGPTPKSSTIFIKMNLTSQDIERTCCRDINNSQVNQFHLSLLVSVADCVSSLAIPLLLLALVTALHFEATTWQKNVTESGVNFDIST